MIAVTPDSVSRIRKFLKAEKVIYKMAFLNNEEIKSKYKVTAFPTLFFIDEKKVLRNVIVGNKENLINEVEKFIDAKN